MLFAAHCSIVCSEISNKQEEQQKEKKMAELLKKKTWAIVGNHGVNPIAEKLAVKLGKGSKTVFLVNPGKPGTVHNSIPVFGSLKDAGGSIEVVDLVINPAKGIAVVEEMKSLGIQNLWIQPGGKKILSWNGHCVCVFFFLYTMFLANVFS